MDTFSKMKDIFYSGNKAFPGLKEPIEEIAFLIDEGYLVCKPFSICSKEEFLGFFENPSLQKEKVYSAAGGEITHVALKIFSAKYLEKEKGQKIHFEQPFCGYYPDAISEDESIVVECGLTQNPDKILTYFLQGKIKELIQVPYPTEESKEVVAYRFTPREDLNEFLAFLQEDKNSQIKNILNNRRRDF